MPRCKNCEALPSPLRDRGNLYIYPPLAPTFAELKRFLKQTHMAFTVPHAGVISLTLTEGSLEQLATNLGALLSPAELQNSKCIIKAPDASITLPDLMQVHSLSALFARVQSRWLIELLGENRLLTHFQPIVHSDDPEKTYGYECFLRGRERNGALIPPIRLFNCARSASLLYFLDRAARQNAISGATERGISKNIFINFNPASIYNPASCLQSTFGAAKAAGISPEAIVFEVVESEHIKEVDQLVSILDFYRANGFKIALDDVGSGYNSLKLMSRLKPDFIKIDVELIRGIDRDPYKAVIVKRLLQIAQELGVRTVAEGIESDAEQQWTSVHGVDYLQGNLFAEPACSIPISVKPTRWAWH